MKYKLGKVCALPWTMNILSKSFISLCNGAKEPMGITIGCTTPTQMNAVRYMVDCANLMPEAESIINSFLAFVKLCEEEDIQIVGTAMKDDEPAGTVDVGGVLKELCETFLAKLNDTKAQ